MTVPSSGMSPQYWKRMTMLEAATNGNFSELPQSCQKLVEILASVDGGAVMS